MTGCNHDLMIFGTSLDGSGVDVAMKMVVGEKIFGGNGVPGAATTITPNARGHITAFTSLSEDGAIVNVRWRDNQRKAWNGGNLFQCGQTQILGLNQMLARCMYPVDLTSRIEATLTNAAAKMDALGLVVGKGGVKPKFSSEPFGELPEGAAWYEATTAHTSTADALITGAVTFPDLILDPEARYRILAGVFHGATLMFARYRAKAGIDVGNAPLASIGGDTDLLLNPIYYSHPSEFTGRNGLELETLCHAGDTSSVGMLLLEKIGGRTVS